MKKIGLYLVSVCLLAIVSMAQKKTPGVYLQEESGRVPAIAEVPSAIPAFIGYTEKADDQLAGDLSRVPRKIFSMVEFEKLFGRPALSVFTKVTLDGNDKLIYAEAEPGPYLLYHSLQLYFANGGGPCYIVSVGNFQSPSQKSDFVAGLDSISKQDEPTLLLFPDAAHLQPDDLYSIQQHALKQAGELGDRFCILDVKSAASPAEHTAAVRGFRVGIGGNHLKQGAAYTPHLKTSLGHSVSYRYWKDVISKNEDRITLGELTNDPEIREKISELEAAIARNDITEKAKEEELLKMFPVMKAITEQLMKTPLLLPPSAAVAAKYCETDKTRGVWKAPANIALQGVKELAYAINSREQEELNVDAATGKSINVIRSFPGKGTLIWGARTLAGNDNEWRYVPVRRFFNMVEESVKKSTQQFVFEPNDANTWQKVKNMIGSYLTLKWREGALMGIKPEQAYYVRAGLGETMTNQDILEGRMIIEIGMATVRPAEFIILRFSLMMPGN